MQGFVIVLRYASLIFWIFVTFDRVEVYVTIFNDVMMILFSIVCVNSMYSMYGTFYIRHLFRL